MAENSAISWTDHTFNPWWGCTKVGPGCDHCYAESFDRRVGGAHWGSGAPRRLVKDWSAPRKWQREAERTGVRPWVFCASMADVFDNEVDPEWRVRLWDLVRETPLLRWIFVTKRIGNAAKMLPPDWPDAFGHCGLMSTIVNQVEADRDVPKLLSTPAAWRGLSMEPLLGPVDLSEWIERIDHCGACGAEHEAQADDRCPSCGHENILVSTWGEEQAERLRSGERYDEDSADGRADMDGISPSLDWIIVGGESGPGARPMHPASARSLRDQCAAAGVPFHFKQWGGWAPAEEPASETQEDEELRVVGAMLDGEYMRRVSKKAAGRLLDGVEHNAMPIGAEQREAAE